MTPRVPTTTTTDPADDANPTTRRRWDAFVAETTGGDLVQTGYWATARTRPGRRTRLVVVREGGQIVGGALLQIARRGRLSVGACPRGPLARPGHEHAAIDALEGVARSEKARVLLVQGPDDGGRVDAALAERGYLGGAPALSPEATVRLDLTKSDEELLSEASSTRRRRLRRAERRGELAVAEEHDLDLFTHLHAQSAQAAGFAPIDAATLRRERDALRPAGLCALYVVRHEGRAVGATWVTRFAGTATLKLTGRSIDAPLVAGSFLIWRIMQDSRQRDLSTLDLGGLAAGSLRRLIQGEQRDSIGDGPAAFKWSFGGEPVFLPVTRATVLSPLGRAAARPLVAALSSPVGRRIVAASRGTARTI